MPMYVIIMKCLLILCPYLVKFLSFLATRGKDHFILILLIQRETH